MVTRTMMLEELWDYRFDPHTSLIDTHISRLRKKIDEGFDTPLLHTVRGSGLPASPERPDAHAAREALDSGRRIGARWWPWPP